MQTTLTDLPREAPFYVRRLSGPFSVLSAGLVLLHFVPEGSVILCEDPEAHLHPMAQAGLADLFVETAKRRKLQILLETHSEHLFRRLQYLIAEGTARNEDCALYYVERADDAGE